MDGVSNGTRAATLAGMSAVRFGPAFVPSRADPATAVDLLLERGYGACEIDFAGGFWMDWDYAKREASNQAIRAILAGEPAPPVPAASAVSGRRSR